MNTERFYEIFEMLTTKLPMLTLNGWRERWPVSPKALKEFRDLIISISGRIQLDSNFQEKSGAILSGAVFLADNVKIMPFTVIEGPCLICEGAKIGPGAYIHGPTWIGPDARVGHSCEIKASILSEAVKFYHFGFIGDSIIGPNANIGAGTVFAVKRLDGRNVIFSQEMKDHITPSKKFGGIIGEGVQIGVGALLMPGVFVEPNISISPGEIVRGAKTVAKKAD